MAVIGFSLILACERTVVCNYVSINGDFQSYNVFRRLLDGQHAYVDFSNYIGAAPIILNLLFVALAGGSFHASLFITTFTTNILFSIAIFIFMRLITKETYFSLLISCITSKIISTQILYAFLGTKYGYQFTEKFVGLYTPSNSMRMARCSLPFLFVLLALLYRRIAGSRAKSFLQFFSSPRACAICGFLLGLALIWSNDYSLACILVMTVIFFLLHIFYYKLKIARALQCLAAYIISFFAGALLSTTIITGGHPMAWLEAFLSVGEYQFFYFNGTGSVPVLTYLFQNKTFWLWAAVFLIYLIFITVRLMQRRLNEEDLLLYFLVACILAGTFAYILSGSGHNFKEALEVFTIFFILGIAVRGICCIGRVQQYIVRPACLIVLCVAAVYFVVQSGFVLSGRTKTAPAGTYIEALLCKLSKEISYRI